MDEREIKIGMYNVNGLDSSVEQVEILRRTEGIQLLVLTET